MATRRPKPTSPAPRGRPRSQRARRAVLDATRALVQEGGYPAATIEAIAARSGVAKTTIYRWWPNRPALVVELLFELAGHAVPVPAGPDPLAAIRTEMRGIAGHSGRLLGKLLTALVGEAQHDPGTRKALLDGLFHPRREATGRMIRQAQAEGRVRAEVPDAIAVDLLVGPIFYRMFVRHAALNDAFVAQVFDTVLAGLGPRPAARRQPASRRARAHRA
jgi:AcrR family transcriptional regulator